MLKTAKRHQDETLWNFTWRPEVRSRSAIWADRRSGLMRINELVRKSVVFLGILDDTGAFAPYGTGFIVVWRPTPATGTVFPFLVTANHVLEDMVATKRPIVCRLNANEGGAHIAQVEPKNWERHPTNPNCDIAVARFSASFDTFNIRGIPLYEGVLTKEYVEENDIGCGDEAITVGLLVSHFGTNKNVPIVRIGNIAAMPEEVVELGEPWGSQEVYLVEARSIGGLSGSPVFLHTPPVRIVKGETKSSGGHKREYIMGVHIGLFETKAHADSLRAGTAEQRANFLDAMSSGIGVVIPIQRVIEIIETSPLFRKQMDELMKSNEKTGFMPTSSAPKMAKGEAEGDYPSTEANPIAREDFTALLDVAERKQGKDD
jgi:hypothetical protein